MIAPLRVTLRLGNEKFRRVKLLKAHVAFNSATRIDAQFEIYFDARVSEWLGRVEREQGGRLPLKLSIQASAFTARGRAGISRCAINLPAMQPATIAFDIVGVLDGRVIP